MQRHIISGREKNLILTETLEGPVSTFCWACRQSQAVRVGAMSSVVGGAQLIGLVDSGCLAGVLELGVCGLHADNRKGLSFNWLTPAPGPLVSRQPAG